MKFYTDMSKLIYVSGALKVIMKNCISENATNEEKVIGSLIADILKDIEN